MGTPRDPEPLTYSVLIRGACTRCNRRSRRSHRRLCTVEAEPDCATNLRGVHKVVAPRLSYQGTWLRSQHPLNVSDVALPCCLSSVLSWMGNPRLQDTLDFKTQTAERYPKSRECKCLSIHPRAPRATSHVLCPFEIESILIPTTNKYPITDAAPWSLSALALEQFTPQKKQQPAPTTTARE